MNYSKLCTLLLLSACSTHLEQAEVGAFGLTCPGCVAPESSEISSRQVALAAKGEAYTPRTEHLDTNGAPLVTNRLIYQTSPYLLQHAHNPVNWYSWGEEAFERARVEGKPVLLSVGYATCHWCHVMERESFEDLEIAQFINENYVAIKVDREVRPDIDEIYMTAVRMMTGRGGWPMTIVMTPDGEPFFGGTYLPPRDTVLSRRPGFLGVLQDLSDRYQNDPTALLLSAASISKRIANTSRPQPSKDVPPLAVVEHTAAQFWKSFDEDWGGWGRAPKFPRATTLEFLMRLEQRAPHPDTLQMITTTLDRMATGGIYDQVGGGFHRYTTDTTWLVPHFEKMLYDNAQLASIYADAWKQTERPLYRRIATETLDYLLREMTAPDGTLYSATDADSFAPNGEREEGWFFTWTEQELSLLLEPLEFRVVKEALHTSSSGNFEGRVIFTRPKNNADVARDLGLSETQVADALSRARKKLYDARGKRPPPLRDDKRLTAWNGLALTALAKGTTILGSPFYSQAMHTLATALLSRGPTLHQRLVRTDDAVPVPAFLDDYTFLTQGLLDAFEASGRPAYLQAAIQLQQETDTHFTDPDGGYFYTADDHEKLISRTRPQGDGAIPSGNSVATMNLLRLAEITQNNTYRIRAEKTLKTYDARLRRSGRSVPKLLSALEFAYGTPLEIVIRYDNTHDATAFRSVLRDHRQMNTVILPAHSSDLSALEKLSPLIAEKEMREGLATAYVCQSGTCQAPTTDPAVFATQLRSGLNTDSL
jgi:uncharacterized protein YyaL (SSP411 family)